MVKKPKPVQELIAMEAEKNVSKKEKRFINLMKPYSVLAGIRSLVK